MKSPKLSLSFFVLVIICFTQFIPLECQQQNEHFLNRLAGRLGRFFKALDFWQETTPRERPKILDDKRWGTHRFIQLKDIRIHYVEKGDRSKPLLILLHGNPEFWFSWRHQLEYFGRTHWVVAPDTRGNGESDKPPGVDNYSVTKRAEDVLQLLEAFGRKDCILTGHDWGGWTAWTIAAKYPEKVQKLIILNTPHPNIMDNLTRSNTAYGVGFNWFHVNLQIPMMLETFSVIGRDPYFRFNSDRFTSEEIEAYKYQYSRRESWEGMLNTDRAALKAIFTNHTNGFGPPEDLPIIEVPTLQIWGTQSGLFFTSQAEEARPLVKNMKIALIHGGHYISFIRFGEVNRIMEKFINSL